MNPRILLVEDDPTTQAFLATAIAALPAEVDAVDRAAAARTLAADHDYALWLVDAHLPDGSGIDLLADLRATGLRTPAVAHTASRDPALRDALLQAGYASVLPKPIAGPALQAALREALARGPARGGRIAEAPPPCHAADAGRDGDAPVWDDDRALVALNGERSHVEALRRLFLDELPASRNAVDDAVRGDDRASLRATLHRLQASCGFVGASRLGAAVIALQSAPEPRVRLHDFLAAADATLARAH